MKTTFRRRWVLFVLRYSRPRLWYYFCLALTGTLTVLQFTRFARVHFLLVMVVLTLMACERLAFAELFTERTGGIDAAEEANRPTGR